MDGDQNSMSAVKGFSVADTLSAAGDIYGRNVVRFTLLFLVLTVVGSVANVVVPGVFIYLIAQFALAMQWFDPQAVGQNMTPVAIVMPVVTTPLVVSLFFACSTALVCAKAVGDLCGRPVSFRHSLTVGLKSFLKAIGIGLIVWLFGLLAVLIPIATGALIVGPAVMEFVGIGFGVLLPVLILLAGAVIWLAVPIAVVEKKGVLASIGRAVSMSRGCRWRIVGTCILVAFLAAIAVLAASLLFSMAAEVLGIRYIEIGMIIPFALVFGWAVTTSPAGYYTLHVAKEGSEALHPEDV